MTSFGSILNRVAACVRAFCGVWLGVHSSSLLPSRTSRCSFPARAGACEMNGYEYAGLDDFRGAAERGVGVAVGPQDERRFLLRELRGLRGVADARLLGHLAFVPRDLQLLARALRLPPAVGDDGDAAVEAEQLFRPLHQEGLPDAGLLLDDVEVR